MEQVHGHGLSWHRSSGCEFSACVELAAEGEWIYLRDGKEPDGAVLRFTRTEWSDFQRGMKHGDFDAI